MKRILYSCLFFVLLQLTNNAYGQQFTVGLSPNSSSVLCYSPNNHTIYAEVIAPCGASNSYSWIPSNFPAGCTPTVTNFDQFGNATNGNSVTILLPGNCCGFYTLEVSGYFNGNPACTPPNNGAYFIPQVLCAGSGVTLTANQNTVCAG